MYVQDLQPVLESIRTGWEQSVAQCSDRQNARSRDVFEDLEQKFVWKIGDGGHWRSRWSVGLAAATALSRFVVYHGGWARW